MQAVTIRWWQRLWTTQVHTRELNPQLIHLSEAYSLVNDTRVNKGCTKPGYLFGCPAHRIAASAPVLPVFFTSIFTGPLLTLNYSYSSPELNSSFLSPSAEESSDGMILVTSPLDLNCQSIAFKSPSQVSGSPKSIPSLWVKFFLREFLVSIKTRFFTLHLHSLDLSQSCHLTKS